ncbi:MAG: hypothetical protein KDI09_09430 [Halioglobus sp.]|nr:hypothetical protein [Halioglobus sp.]
MARKGVLLHATQTDEWVVPGDHVHPKRPETIQYITEVLFGRISMSSGALP